MCDDCSDKLIAWLDRELSDGEAAEVERHVRSCAECGESAGAYAKAASDFDEYCEAVLASKLRRGLPRWVPALAGSAAGVAAMLLVFAGVFPRTRVERAPVRAEAALARSGARNGSGLAAIPPTTVPAKSAAGVKRLQQRHGVRPAQSQTASWVPSGPAIEIAIPAEAMFPPGAVPEGINFAGDVTIAADGSAERLSLRPRVVRYDKSFEGRTNQP